jgi:uncharacterized protein (DUF2141 family)
MHLKPFLGILLSIVYGQTAAAVDAVPVSVRIEGLTSQQGQVVLQVYDDPKTFLDQSTVVVIPLDAVDPTDGSVTAVVSLPPVAVGICAYHDRNHNGTIDRTMVGIPLEPYGWSRGKHFKWTPPFWNEVALPPPDESPDPASVVIRLRDW